MKRIAFTVAALMLGAPIGLLAQLPPEIELDRLIVQFETALAEEELSLAHTTVLRIEALRDKLDIELPHEYFFLKARHCLNITDYTMAIKAVTEYLTLAGREGEHYREALALMNRAEREQHLAEARARRTREEQERVRKALAGMEFVAIQAGEMPRGFYETVQRIRITRPFELSKYEVTQDQWELVMGTRPSGFSGCGRCPVENVSWEDAREFARKIKIATEGFDYDLPTYWEWTYAARAGAETDYPGGLDRDSVSSADDEGRVPPIFDAVAWHEGNSGQRTHPVGEKTPNAWGLHDMLGNVAEWTRDAYAWPERSPPPVLTDPVGSIVYNRSSIQGGSWNDYFFRCRFEGNVLGDIDTRSKSVGFRLVRRAIE